MYPYNHLQTADKRTNLIQFSFIVQDCYQFCSIKIISQKSYAGYPLLSIVKFRPIHRLVFSLRSLI